MAEYGASAAPADEGPFKELTKEALERLAACENQKREFDLDIRESYYFTNPHRAREIRSAQALTASKPNDGDSLQTGLASELCDDFMTELINGFMPPSAPFWAERRPGPFIPEELREQVKAEAGKADAKIFEAIKASNLYQEMPKLSPDPAIGTAAMWIEDPRPAESVVVQAIPLHELEINLGPFGTVDDRFVVRHTKNRHVKALIGAVFDKLDEECRKKIAEKPDESTILRWGYWRKWDRMDDVVWQHVLMLDRKVVHATLLVGEGSCPLLPWRFNPTPEWAYGSGPLIKTLPDLRQIDDLELKKIEHVDLTLAPPSYYPDDSFTAVAQGVESHTMYPKRPGGNASDVGPIFPVGSMEPAIYEQSEKERSLRRRFYVDLPQQRGDTPPTATQWLDEMQLALRRFGTPGASFWRECPAEIFLRFKYLLEKRQIIAPITVDGKTVSLQPFNPAERAAEMEQVAQVLRYLQTMLALFPEEAKARINASETMKKIAELMRVLQVVVFRSDDELKQALAMIAPLIGQQGGGGPQGGAPAAPGMAA